LKEINRGLEAKKGKNTKPGMGQPFGKHMGENRFQMSFKLLISGQNVHVH
jgi:hypothetical protein